MVPELLSPVCTWHSLKITYNQMDQYYSHKLCRTISKQIILSLFLKKLSKDLRWLPVSTRILVGISGGRDSMCLLYGLLELGYQKLILCHLNHALRGMESKVDEYFVVCQARRFGLLLRLEQVQTRKFALDQKLCVEMAGRELRYAFFFRVAQETGYTTLLLAHHAGDQIETCWLNFLRGTGVAGLAGMRMDTTRNVEEKNGSSLRVVRPLLKISPSEIVEFSRERNIPFRVDATNWNTNPVRNRIRHKLLPFLDRTFGVYYRKSILRCAEILADEEDWMKEVSEGFPYKARLAYKELYPFPRALQRRILRSWLIRQRVPEIGFKEVECVRSLITPPISTSSKVSLPAGICARRKLGVLFLEKNEI